MQEDRQQFFDNFWKNTNLSQRIVYVASLVDNMVPKNRNIDQMKPHDVPLK